MPRVGRTIPAQRHYQRALSGMGDCVACVRSRLLAQGDTAQATAPARPSRGRIPFAYISRMLLAERGDQAARSSYCAPGRASEITMHSPRCDLLMNGRCSEAEACFRKALAGAPQNAEFLLRLGASLRAQDRFEEARVALAEASRAAPRLAEAARRWRTVGSRRAAVVGLGSSCRSSRPTLTPSDLAGVDQGNTGRRPL
jgi:tetratricopeptide (TPR) repeat protein